MAYNCGYLSGLCADWVRLGAPAWRVTIRRWLGLESAEGLTRLDVQSGFSLTCLAPGLSSLVPKALHDVALTYLCSLGWPRTPDTPAM